MSLTPLGHLRASINLGNPLLAGRDTDGGPAGVSVDLAHALGAQLGVSVELVLHESAAASVATVRAERADVGFFAIDPARSEGLLFTASYVLIEGAWLVPDGFAGEVDVPATRVAVGSGSAYDLFLTRSLVHAELVRHEGAAPALAALRSGDVEVAAGIRQVVAAEAARAPGLRVLPEPFMVIQQAMGLPASRGPEAQAELAAFIEQQKASGAVAEALGRHGVEGATVAPPAA